MVREQQFWQSLAIAAILAISLGVVNRTAVALLAGSFLHVGETLLLFFQLAPRPFHFLLLLQLTFVPFLTTIAAGAHKMNRVVEFVDCGLQGADPVLLRLNLLLPLRGR